MFCILLSSGDVSEKYSFMEAQLADRSNQLQSALTQSHSVQDGISDLLRWLDQAERKTNMVINTPVRVKKEALLEMLQEQKVRRIIKKVELFETLRGWHGWFSSID